MPFNEGAVFYIKTLHTSTTDNQIQSTYVSLSRSASEKRTSTINLGGDQFQSTVCLLGKDGDVIFFCEDKADIDHLFNTQHCNKP